MPRGTIEIFGHLCCQPGASGAQRWRTHFVERPHAASPIVSGGTLCASLNRATTRSIALIEIFLCSHAQAHAALPRGQGRFRLTRLARIRAPAKATGGLGERSRIRQPRPGAFTFHWH